jgi:hypothetical protein
LDALRHVGIINFVDDTWLVVNFSKRQGRNSVERRQYWRDQKRSSRGQLRKMSAVSSEDSLRTLEDNVQSVRALEGEGEEEVEVEEDEKKNRVDVDALTTSFFKATLIPINNSSKTKQALLKLLAAHVQPIDITTACNELRAKNLTISDLSSIVKPAMICMSNRIHGDRNRRHIIDLQKYAEWETSS